MKHTFQMIVLCYFKSSSEDDWASCQEETPIRISSTSTVVIGSSDASDGIGETKEAGGCTEI